MSLIVRRINRAKWEQVNLQETDDVTADTITNCLKTTNNDLSVWLIESLENLEDAILALITGAKQERLSKLDIVFLELQTISDSGLLINDTEGDTVAESLKHTHRDISELTYTKLGIFKDLVLSSLREEKTKFYTEGMLKTLLRKAISEGKILKDNLNPKLIEKANL